MIMSKLLTLGDPITSTIQLVVFDFDGVFTDNTVWIDQQGNESVRCWRSDGLGLAKLKKINIPVHVLSTEANAVVIERCKKLQIPCTNNLPNKAAALQQLMQQHNLTADQVAYVGNDINDLECLQLVGVSIVVADAYPEAAAVAKYQTSKPGGLGAVREVCDWIQSAYE